MERNKRISASDLIFLSFISEDYSRSGTLRASMPESIFILLPKSILKVIDTLIKSRKKKLFGDKIIVIMSPCHILSPVTRIILRNKIVLDAGWPLTDAFKSRNTVINFQNCLIFIRSFVTDLICFKSAHYVSLESNQQIEKVIKTFGIKRQRLFRSFTGLNEVLFKSRTDIQCPIADICPICDQSQKPFIFFRGKCNPEAGVDRLARITKSLAREEVNFVVASTNLAPEISFSNKTRVLEQYLSEPQLAHLYFGARFSVGQIGEIDRINFTIPHKAFESAYFKVPYLTRDTRAIRELLVDNDSALFFNCDGSELESVFKRHIHDEETSKIGENGNRNYSSIASQLQIRHQFLENLNQKLLLQ